MRHFGIRRSLLQGGLRQTRETHCLHVSVSVTVGQGPGVSDKGPRPTQLVGSVGRRVRWGTPTTARIYSAVARISQHYIICSAEVRISQRYIYVLPTQLAGALAGFSAKRAARARSLGTRHRQL